MNRASIGVAVSALALAAAITIAVGANSKDPTVRTASSSDTTSLPTADLWTSSSDSATTTTDGLRPEHSTDSMASESTGNASHSDHATGSTSPADLTATTHGRHGGASSTTSPHGDVTTTTHDHGGNPDELDPTLQLILNAQIAYIRENVIEQYPTASLSSGGGWIRAGRFSPGAGAHYVNINSGMNYGGDLDLDTPMALIYDGIGPQSEIVGVMYYSWQATPPDAFVGTNDVWHKHTSVCFKFNPDSTIDIPFPVDTEDISRQDCEALGATYLEQTAWMLHVWAAEGHESSDGVFSHVNPDLNCYDGTWDTDDLGFCDGSEVG